MFNRPLQSCLATVLIAAFVSPSVYGFNYLGGEPTKWNLGGNSAEVHGFAAPDGPGTPGAVSWSFMPTGVGFSPALGGRGETSGGGQHPDGDESTDIEFLITPAVDGLEYAIFEDALSQWIAVSGLIGLGRVTDGGTHDPPPGVGAPDSEGGHLGDIRVGAFDFAFADPRDELAEAFQPGTDLLYGAGGTIAGDMHFNRSTSWIDDPNDLSAAGDFDFYTVALHEIGHALGLGHSDHPDAVMHADYGGSRRTLHADDIAGIVALYGPPVPEPTAVSLVAAVVLLAGCRRFCR